MGNSSTQRNNKSKAVIMNSDYVRRAHHAGSWYDNDPLVLDNLLSKFIQEASESMTSSLFSEEGESTAVKENGTIVKRIGAPRACISPHAGFRYSGSTAAHSFLALKEALLSNTLLRTVVVLHPSHHVYMDGCAVSGASELRTPLRNLQVDKSLSERLLSTGKFTVLKREVDENEHSAEMQYPFIAKILNDMEKTKSDKDQFEVKVLPIMVGSIRRITEEAYGILLAPFLSDQAVFTVVSSDFCHWGKRFNYTPQPSPAETMNEVYDYIEYLDRKGMDLISSQSPGAFADYLCEYSNTICGRHPIAVWLNAIKTNRERGAEHVAVRFVKYAQSEKATSLADSSVSYASAVARVIN